MYRILTTWNGVCHRFGVNPDSDLKGCGSVTAVAE